MSLSPEASSNPLFPLMMEAYDELGANRFAQKILSLVLEVLRQKEDERSPLGSDFSAVDLDRVLARERELVLIEYDDVQDCDRYIDFLSSEWNATLFVDTHQDWSLSGRRASNCSGLR